MEIFGRTAPNFRGIAVATTSFMFRDGFSELLFLYFFRLISPPCTSSVKACDFQRRSGIFGRFFLSQMFIEIDQVFQREIGDRPSTCTDTLKSILEDGFRGVDSDVRIFGYIFIFWTHIAILPLPLHAVNGTT